MPITRRLDFTGLVQPTGGMPSRPWAPPVMRQVTSANGATNTFSILPLPGSVLVHMGSAESGQVITASGGGVTTTTGGWVRVAEQGEGSGEAVSVFIGIVGVSPSTSVSSSGGSTRNVQTIEFLNLKGLVIEYSQVASAGPLGPLTRHGYEGVAVSVSGHRGITPAVPSGGWVLLAQQNNDLSCAWMPLWRHVVATWGAGGSSRNQTMVAII